MEQLQRVLGSAGFTSSPRLSRFLEFVVQETLAGRADQVKESVIAVHVFGRDSSYNPQTDSTVRVGAAKLRARLREYNLLDGRQDEVLIERPKGGYVPVFHSRGPRMVRPRVIRFLAAAAVPSLVLAVAAAWWVSREPGLVSGLFGAARGAVFRPSSAHSRIPLAEEKYWRGRYYRDRFPRGRLPEALRYFEEAIEADPGFAAAHATAAYAYAQMGFHLMAPLAESVRRARAEAQMALSLDASQAEAHAALGLIAFSYDWDWPAAEKHFRTALKLQPEAPGIHREYALGLMSRGRMEHALAETQAAVRLDPVSAVPDIRLATVWFASRRYQETERSCRLLLDVRPADGLALSLLGASLLHSGRPREAIPYLEQAAATGEANSSILGRLGAAYAKAGNQAAALEIARRLTSSGQRSPEFQAVHLAYVRAALGDVDGALSALEEAAARRDPDFVYMPFEPEFDTLRGVDRYRALARKLGFE